MFDETQITKICKVLEISRIRYNQQVLTYAPYITAEVESSVLEDLDLYDAFIDKSHIKIKPNDPNFGAQIDFSSKIEEIKTNIANALQFDGFGSNSEMAVYRG